MSRNEAKLGIEIALVDFAFGNGLILGPIAWEEIAPSGVSALGIEHQGSISCLVGTSDIVGTLAELSPTRLTRELPEEQLVAMRRATNRAFRKAGGARNLTDEELDQIINKEGPDVAVTIH